MRWKLLLAVLVILGIAGLLFFWETGTGYLNFLKNKVGEFTSIIFKWVAPGGKQFSITLTADKEIFYGQKYKISNSTFEGSGAVKELKINSAVSTVTQASIKIEAMKDSFEITRQNSVKISADAASIVINAVQFLNTNVYVEMLPSSFLLSQFNQDKLMLYSVNGQVKTEEGWVKELSNADIEIQNFKGSLKSDGDQAVLEGLTSKLVVDGKEVTIASK
jgi:hypothetical protein